MNCARTIFGYIDYNLFIKCHFLAGQSNEAMCNLNKRSEGQTGNLPEDTQSSTEQEAMTVKGTTTSDLKFFDKLYFDE